MLGQRVVNNILGNKPKADRKSKNKYIGWCDGCNEKKELVDLSRNESLCKKCSERKYNTEDWGL